LDSSWIKDSLDQHLKPILPDDFSVVATKLDLPNAKINRDLPNFKQIIKKIESIYTFDNIPDEWISKSLPNLPSLQETKTLLASKDVQISLPIIESPELGTQIRKLKSFFFFDLLPNEFIESPALPEPGSALLPIIY
jgi:hypothetical protein